MITATCGGVYFLLIAAIALGVDGQLAGSLVVDVEARSDVQIFWFISDPNTGIDINYTVYYGLNLSDPMNFTSSSPGAQEQVATDPNSLTLMNIPSSTAVTVVVVARSASGNLESSPPVTKRTFGSVDISVPANIMIRRLDSNKTLQVTWEDITTIGKIVSYDTEYRVEPIRSGTADVSMIPSTFISIAAGGPLVATIRGVDENTNYEARVRGNIEIAGNDPSDIAMMNGPWSAWYVSQVKIDQGGLGGGATSVVSNGIIFTAWLTILLLVALFF